MSKSIKITLIAIISAIVIAAGSITAVSLHRNSPEYMLSLAERYLSELDYEQAIIYYEKYLEIEPKDKEVWLSLAEAYEELGDSDKVIKVLERAVEIADSNKAAQKLDEIRKSQITTVTNTTTPAPVTTTVTTTPTTTTTPMTTVVTTEESASEHEWLTNYTLSNSDIELIDDQFSFMSHGNGQVPPLFLEGEMTEKLALSLAFNSIGGSMITIAPNNRISPELRDVYDPLGKFIWVNGYGETYLIPSNAYDAVEVDKALYHIFGVNATHKTDLEFFYYYDGYYYIPNQAAGGTAISEFAGYHLTSDGRFIIEIDYADNFAAPDWNRYYILVSAHKEAERVYIRYHAITDNIRDVTQNIGIVQTFEATTTTTTTTTTAVTTEEPFAVETVTILGKEVRTDITEFYSDSIFESVAISKKDLVNIGKCKKLTRLTLTNHGISDISFLKELTDLTYLELWGNEISDITPLKSLTNLTTLWLGYNEISDITPLKNLINLEFLDLENDMVVDISPIKNLTKLTYFSSSGNPVSDVSPLKNLKKLDFLDISGADISDISSIGNLTKLTSLSVAGTRISDISPLKKLTKLTYLNLNSNEIFDITSLKKLVNLEELNLGWNKISDISVLKNLTNLKELRLTDNNVSKKKIESLQKSLPDCEIYF